MRALATKIGIPNFKVVMHDELIGQQIGDLENTVVNLDRRPNGSGTHFVAICNLPNRKECVYFDSFGVTPSDIIKKYMKTSGKKCIYNDGGSELQKYDSSACGYYCLYFLEKMNHGKKTIDIIEKFKQEPSEFNEKMMRKYSSNITK
jgi:hypothetical protein